MWCWRRLLRVPWNARWSNQSVLREINPKYSLEGLMLKLKLQYFGHLIWRTYSLEKDLMLGKIEGKRRGRQRMRGWDDIINSMDMRLSKLREMVKDRKSWHATVHGIAKSAWTTNGHLRLIIFLIIAALRQEDYKASWFMWKFLGEKNNSSTIKKTFKSNNIFRNSKTNTGKLCGKRVFRIKFLVSFLF